MLEFCDGLFCAMVWKKKARVEAVCAEERDRSVILQGSSVTIFGWFRGNFCMTTAQKSRSLLAQEKRRTIERERVAQEKKRVNVPLSRNPTEGGRTE